MEKDITQNQEQVGEAKKDIQLYQVVSNFIKDKDGVNVYRRAEKICKAYFLLTQHIQENNSIKQKLRNLALDMSSKTLDLVVTFNKTEELARGVVTQAMALVSVSDIAVTARFISEANYSLVVHQVQIFINEVETYWKTSSHNNQVMPIHLFDVESLDASYKNDMSFMTRDHSETSRVDVQEIPRAGAVKTHMVKNERVHTTNISGNGDKTRRDLEYKKTVSSSSTIKGIKDESKTEGKSERQTLILSTISTRGESSIKDLADVIKGCSEKTIQRELISLVSSGELLKTGERRWSRYSIAH
jgi:hypothetical protein